MARNHSQGEPPGADLEVVRARPQVHRHAEGMQVGGGDETLLRVPRVHDVHGDAPRCREVLHVELRRADERSRPGAECRRRGVVPEGHAPLRGFAGPLVACHAPPARGRRAPFSALAAGGPSAPFTAPSPARATLASRPGLQCGEAGLQRLYVREVQERVVGAGEGRRAREQVPFRVPQRWRSRRRGVSGPGRRVHGGGVVRMEHPTFHLPGARILRRVVLVGVDHHVNDLDEGRERGPGEVLGLQVVPESGFVSHRALAHGMPRRGGGRGLGPGGRGEVSPDGGRRGLGFGARRHHGLNQQPLDGVRVVRFLALLRAGVGRVEGRPPGPGVEGRVLEERELLRRRQEAAVLRGQRHMVPVPDVEPQLQERDEAGGRLKWGDVGLEEAGRDGGRGLEVECFPHRRGRTGPRRLAPRRLLHRRVPQDLVAAQLVQLCRRQLAPERGADVGRSAAPHVGRARRGEGRPGKGERTAHRSQHRAGLPLETVHGGRRRRLLLFLLRRVASRAARMAAPPWAEPPWGAPVSARRGR